MPEVNVCRGQIVDALMVSVVIIVIYERTNLRFQVCREVVVVQQDAVFQGLVPALDFALCLRMVRRTPDVTYFPVSQPLRQFA